LSKLLLKQLKLLTKSLELNSSDGSTNVSFLVEDSSEKAEVVDKTSLKFRQLNYIVLYMCNSVLLVIST